MAPFVLIVIASIALAIGVGLIYMPAGLIAAGVLGIAGGISWDLLSDDESPAGDGDVDT